MVTLFIAILGVGCLLLLWAARKEIRWSRQRSIVAEAKSETEQVVLGAFDYRALIVANSSWLSYLHRLDNDFSKKLRIIAGCVAILAVLKFTGLAAIDINTFSSIAVLLMIFVIVVPAIVVNFSVKTRSKVMMDSLPYFIDLIAVCVQTGMTVESAVKFIAERFREMDKNIASLMLHLTRRAEVCGLEEALTELYNCVEMSEMRMFSSMLQQSIHYGSALYDSLMQLSQDIREMQLLESEEKIGKLSAKMSVPLILFIMLPITVLIAAPGIMRVLKHAIF